MEVASRFPNTPTRLGDFFFSAPASPSRVSDFFHPTPANNDDGTDFAFEFSEDLERTSLSADELFHGGVIRPLEAIRRGRSPAPELPPTRSGRRAVRSLSPPPKPSSPAKSSRSPSSSSKKWRLRDFLLFRSASEGRAAEKDPLRKYSVAAAEEVIGRRRRRSAHEVHYMANKAMSEEMKKKTFLPYKQGILGRLAFNPALHAISNGFGSLSLSRA